MDSTGPWSGGESVDLFYSLVGGVRMGRVTNDWGENFTASNRFVVNTNASDDRLVKCGVYSGYRLWLRYDYQRIFEKDAR
jgi:hypothetical protein